MFGMLVWSQTISLVGDHANRNTLLRFADGTCVTNSCDFLGRNTGKLLDWIRKIYDCFQGRGENRCKDFEDVLKLVAGPNAAGLFTVDVWEKGELLWPYGCNSGCPPRGLYGISGCLGVCLVLAGASFCTSGISYSVGLCGLPSIGGSVTFELFWGGL